MNHKILNLTGHYENGELLSFSYMMKNQIISDFIGNNKLKIIYK